MLVTSCIDGRIRIRDPQLTHKGVAEAVCEVLSALPGISRVTVNERVGSLLVRYSAAVTKLQSILEGVAGLLGAGEETTPYDESGGQAPLVSGIKSLGLAVRKATVNMGMLASLLTSMIGIMLGLKKLHYAAGILFLAIFGIHIFERRRAMFAWP